MKRLNDDGRITVVVAAVVCAVLSGVVVVAAIHRIAGIWT